MAVSAPPAKTARGPGRAVLARPARRRSSFRKTAELTLLLAPSVVLFVGFVLAPIGIAIYYSFHSYNGFASRYLGWRNYHLVLTDPAFQHAIEHNFIIAGLSLILQFPLAIGIALLLSRKIRGRAFLRLVTFAPYVIAEAIAAVIWLLMLQPDGFVDRVLKSVGLGGLVHDWLASQTLVLYTMFVVLTWKYLGFTIILLVAGLQGIPPELREAAAIDGATPWQATRRVVLPLLGPTIRIAVFLSMIGSLQLFDMVWIMTQGGPADASATMATYMVSQGFQRYEYGYGSAVSVVLFVICFVFALLYQRFALRRDIDGSLTQALG